MTAMQELIEWLNYGIEQEVNVLNNRTEYPVEMVEHCRAIINTVNWATKKANELLETERKQIVDAANDVLAQNNHTYYGTPDLGEEYYVEHYSK